MTTAPAIKGTGTYVKLHTTNPADMPPILKGDACLTQIMWETVSIPTEGAYKAFIEASKKAALPIRSPKQVFKPFTALEMLAKVHGYIKAAWMRNELGFWQVEQGAICFMGGVYRFLVFEASTNNYSPHAPEFNNALMTHKQLTEGLRAFALVVEEQFPIIPKLVPIKHMDIQTLSNYIISFNDRYARDGEEICALLEKAMVRELERV